jgi:hypothetical protein
MIAGNLHNWLPKQTAGKEELTRAATECLFAYHTVMHNHSFRSMDCTSKLIKNLYDNKFSSARTKTESIVTDVIVPYVMEGVKSDLNSVSFVSVSTDASNHNATKMLPVLVQYFVPEKGIQVKMLDMVAIPGETSEIITNTVTEAIDKFTLKDKVIGFSADNTNANFGGARRKGQVNVFTKLQTYTGRPDLLGLGCNAHMLHNTVQTAADCLPVDAQQIVCKIYNYFSVHTVRVTQLEQFCADVEVEYRKLLGYSKTRWLALLPAVERILQTFEGLKSYFRSLKQCPTVIQQFFENPLSEAWLFFIQCQTALFTKITKNIECQHGTAMEVRREIQKIKSDLFNRKQEKFIGFETKNMLRKLEEEGDVSKRDVEVFMSKAVSFFDSCLEYIELWDHSQDVTALEWVLLEKEISWEDVDASCHMVIRTSGQVNLFLDSSELFTQAMCVKRYVTEETILRWKNEQKNAGERWVELLQHFVHNNIEFCEILKIVQFALALPGTNAPVERVFSLMNDLWTDEKSQMLPDTVKAMLLVKVNMHLSCSEFHQKVKDNEKLLKCVHGSKKYKWLQVTKDDTGSSSSLPGVPAASSVNATATQSVGVEGSSVD